MAASTFGIHSSQPQCKGSHFWLLEQRLTAGATFSHCYGIQRLTALSNLSLKPPLPAVVRLSQAERAISGCCTCSELRLMRTPAIPDCMRLPQAVAGRAIHFRLLSNTATSDWPVSNRHSWPLSGCRRQGEPYPALMENSDLRLVRPPANPGCYGIQRLAALSNPSLKPPLPADVRLQQAERAISGSYGKQRLARPPIPVSIDIRLILTWVLHGMDEDTRHEITHQRGSVQYKCCWLKLQSPKANFLLCRVLNNAVDEFHSSDFLTLPVPSSQSRAPGPDIVRQFWNIVVPLTILHTDTRRLRSDQTRPWMKHLLNLGQSRNR